MQPEHICSASAVSICIVPLPQEVSNSTTHGSPSCKMGQRALIMRNLKVQLLQFGSSQ